MLQVQELQTLPYREAYELQLRLHRARVAGEIPDQLVLLQHPAVITVPRRAGKDNLLLTPDQLEDRLVTVEKTDRGGDVTLHSPGQLVGYLICELGPGKRDLHGFLRWIEVCLQRVAESQGLETGFRKGLTGLWIEDRKLASIGLAVKRWVTLHGFALNVNNDLELFRLIHPCGLVGVQMTSLSQETGQEVSWDSLLKQVALAFDAIWHEGLTKGSCTVAGETGDARVHA